MKKTIYEVYVDGVLRRYFALEKDVENYVNQLTLEVSYFLSSERVENDHFLVVSIYLDENVL